MNNNALFLGGKQAFFAMKNKKQNKTNTRTKKQKENKEGLGPSEVALWATSLDP